MLLKLNILVHNRNVLKQLTMKGLQTVSQIQSSVFGLHISTHYLGTIKKSLLGVEAFGGCPRFATHLGHPYFANLLGGGADIMKY